MKDPTERIVPRRIVPSVSNIDGQSAVEDVVHIGDVMQAIPDQKNARTLQ